MLLDQILLTLMKLRQKFIIADLARHFKRSPRQVSKILQFWMDVIAEHTKDLVPWLPHETIKAIMTVFVELVHNPEFRLSGSLICCCCCCCCCLRWGVGFTRYNVLWERNVCLVSPEFTGKRCRLKMTSSFAHDALIMSPLMWNEQSFSKPHLIGKRTNYIIPGCNLSHEPFLTLFL